MNTNTKVFEEGSWLIFIECVEWQFPKFSHCKLLMYIKIFSYLGLISTHLRQCYNLKSFKHIRLVYGVISWGKHHKETSEKTSRNICQIKCTPNILFLLLSNVLCHPALFINLRKSEAVRKQRIEMLNCFP